MNTVIKHGGFVEGTIFVLETSEYKPNFKVVNGGHIGRGKA